MRVRPTESSSRGAVLLWQWLVAHSLTLPELAERTGISRQQLADLIRGDQRRISAEHAVLLERETKRYVRVEAWLPEGTL
jgi:transcriptional regulator with XRE-family HTH domain